MNLAYTCLPDLRLDIWLAGCFLQLNQSGLINRKGWGFFLFLFLGGRGGERDGCGHESKVSCEENTYILLVTCHVSLTRTRLGCSFIHSLLTLCGSSFKTFTVHFVIAWSNFKAKYILSCDVVNVFHLQARQGRTTLISTCHVIVSSLADHVLVLRHGEVIEGGVPRELLQSPGVYRYLSILEVSISGMLVDRKDIYTLCRTIESSSRNAHPGTASVPYDVKTPLCQRSKITWNLWKVQAPVVKSPISTNC